MNKIILSATSVAIVCSGLLVQLARAQSPTNTLTLTPPSFEYTVEPGGSVSDTLRLENSTDRPLKIRAQKRNFTAQGEEGDVNLTEESNTFSLASWLSVAPEEIIIPARSRQTFTFSINVPKDVEPGGHFGSVVFATVPESNLDSTGFLLSQEIGALILVKVNGDVNEKAVIASFAPTSPFYEFGPVTLDARVQNLGNVHLRPTGIVELTDMFGNKQHINLESRNVLPESVRKLSAILDNKLLFGRYTATLNVSYGSQNQNLVATTEFFAFPVRYALIALAVFVFIFILRKRLARAVKALFAKEK